MAFGGVGGHRAVVSSLSHALRDDGVTSVGVFVAMEGAGEDDWMHGRADTCLASIVYVPIKHRGDVTSMLRVASAIRNEQPAVVICHAHRHIAAAWIGFVLTRRWPRLVLVEHQQVSLRSAVDDLWSLVGVITCRAIVVLSPDYEARYRWRNLAQRLRRKIYVIPNGVPTQPSATLAPVGPPVIGMASRLIASKDYRTLLSAVKLLHKVPGLEDLKLKIAGVGPDGPALERYVNDLGISNSVEFCGPIPQSGMGDFYRSLSCYVQATYGETLSMSLLEAGSFGLPLIASDVPGVNDLLTDGANALLVPPADPNALAHALRVLLDPDRCRALGDEARALVEKSYGTRQFAERYLEVIRAVVK